MGLTVRLVVLSLLLTPCAWAQGEESGEEEPVFLGDLLVTPKRVPGLAVSESRYPGNATVISESEISASGQRTMTELLNRLEGVQMIDSRGFGMGADSGLNLRGFVNSSRTNALVLVDGVRQNRITGDEVHWQAIPVEQVERIEVIRGGAGTIYGEGAFSGVVNVITKKGGVKPLQVEGSAEVGSYSHLRATSVVRGAQKRFSYSLGTTRQEEGGYRDRVLSRGTTVNLFTGFAVSPRTQLDLHLSNHQDTTNFAGGITRAQVEQDRKRAGSFPGLFDEHIDRVSLELTHGAGSGWTGVGNLFWSRWESDSLTTNRFATIASTKGVGLRASHEAAGRIWKATSVFGVDAADDKATTGNRTAAKSESNRVAAGLFIEETLDLFDRLGVTAGFRYDKSRYEEDLTFPAFAGTLRFSGSSPKGGLTYQVSDRMSLFASVARSFKAPNIDDLDAVLPPFNDATDLQPQEANHLEAGFRWNPVRWARIKLAGFGVHTKDEILFNPFTSANANFTTRRAGLELGLEGDLPWRGITTYGTYSLLKATFHKGAFTGYEIPATPRHKVTCGLHLPLTRGLSADLDTLWVGKQWRINDFNNQLPADIYGVVNLALNFQLPRRAKAYFKLLNLLDEEYETFPSSNGTVVSTGENPAPPRTFAAGVSWDF
ncbi:MAG: TonB-dependent receptor [Candidatus Omnitrophica bacterium]|nr:TonB-dependent receptor [Candidatus Omnitrophota bacterium]